MTRRMYDSVNVASIPADATMVAGYVAGTYANVDKLRKRFPNATLVTIATNAAWDANVLDVETHAATVQQAPAWCVRQRKAGRIPTVYTLASWWPVAKREFASQGVPEPFWWLAKYDNKPEMIPGAVAKQYGGQSGYDLSIVADYWPGIDPLPTGDIVRTYKVVSVPAPDDNGRQIVGVPELHFDTVSSVQIKANDNGDAVRAIVQPFAYGDHLACSFQHLDGVPLPTGLVGLIIEHR